MIINVFTLAAFAAFAFVSFFFAHGIVKLQRNPIRERLAAITLGNVDFAEISTSSRNWRQAFADQLPQTRRDNGVLDYELRRAGYYKGTARYEFLGLRNASVILVLLTAGIIVVGIGPEQQTLAIKVLAGGLSLAGLAFSIPRYVLRYIGMRRVERLRRALPDALDMMTMCLTGGLPVQEALVNVSREIYLPHPDLAVELMIVQQHAEMNSLEDAFRQFARRIDISEITNFSALISQSQRLGTNVSESINNYADEIRTKRRQQADERANKASVKLLFPVIMCLIPAVIIILWGPAAIELLNFFRGFDGASADAIIPP